MTVKELIIHLLDEDMNQEVKLEYPKKHIDRYDVECSGYMFDIDKISHFGNMLTIEFTDWRDEK